MSSVTKRFPWCLRLHRSPTLMVISKLMAEPQLLKTSSTSKSLRTIRSDPSKSKRVRSTMTINLVKSLVDKKPVMNFWEISSSNLEWRRLLTASSRSGLSSRPKVSLIWRRCLRFQKYIRITSSSQTSSPSFKKRSMRQESSLRSPAQLTTNFVNKEISKKSTTDVFSKKNKS